MFFEEIGFSQARVFSDLRRSRDGFRLQGMRLGWGAAFFALESFRFAMREPRLQNALYRLGGREMAVFWSGVLILLEPPSKGSRAYHESRVVIHSVLVVSNHSTSQSRLQLVTHLQLLASIVRSCPQRVINGMRYFVISE